MDMNSCQLLWISCSLIGKTAVHCFVQRAPINEFTRKCAIINWRFIMRDNMQNCSTPFQSNQHYCKLYAKEFSIHWIKALGMVKWAADVH